MSTVFLVSGFIFLIASASYCLIGKKSAAFACIPAVILLLFANLDRINSFKVGPSSVEAKLTEKLSDAENILDKLKKLAVATSKALIRMRESSHALIAGDAASEFSEQDAYKASILQTLKDMDLPPSVIKEVEQSDSDIVLGFYSYAAWRFGSDGFLPSEEKRQAFDKAYANLSDEQKHSPEALQRLLSGFHVDASAFGPYMEDFIYYARNKEQRRPAVWANRERWGYGITTPGSVFAKEAPSG